MRNLPFKENKLVKKFKYQSGQALLLVLLGMAVILTITLSVVSRSITDITVTRKDEESLRAFSAAEAGVEQAFVVGSDLSETLDNESSFTADISGIAENQDYYNLEDKLLSGEVATVWFVGHDDAGNLSCSGFTCFTGNSIDNLCWSAVGESVSDGKPAVEIAVYYDDSPGQALAGDYSDVKVARYAYDPDPLGHGSNFDTASETNCTLGGGIDSKEYEYQTGNISLNIGCSSTAGCLLFARIRMLYNTLNEHSLGIEVPNPLPRQGLLVTSTGEYSDATRKVEASKTFGLPLSIFESAIMSFGTEDDLDKDDAGQPDG